MIERREYKESDLPVELRIRRGGTESFGLWKSSTKHIITLNKYQYFKKIRIMDKELMDIFTGYMKDR